MAKAKIMKIVVSTVIAVIAVPIAVLFGVQAYYNYQAVHYTPPGIIPDIPGKIDSLHDYVQALDSSTDPCFIAIRNQIANGPTDLAKEEAIARGLGIPLTIDTPVLPLDENAATLYQKWRALQRADNLDEPNYFVDLSARYRYTPTQLASVRQIIKLHHPEYVLLNKAIDQTKFVPIPGDLYSMSELREASREIRTESVMLALDGRYVEAISTQTDGFKIAKQVLQNPGIVRYSLCESITAVTLSGFGSILHIAGPNATVDRLVKRTIRLNAPKPSFVSALKGDPEAELQDTARLLATASPVDINEFVQYEMEVDQDSNKWSTAPLAPADKTFVNDLNDECDACYLAKVYEYLAQANEPPVARLVSYEKIAREPSQYFDSSYEGLTDMLTGYPMDETYPDMHIEYALYVTPAQVQVTLAAADVLAIKAETGNYPKSLLSGFGDPFNDNKPLGYRLAGKDGFVVYSVAPDGKYDGRMESGVDSLYHAVFRYPGPPKIPVPKDDE